MKRSTSPARRRSRAGLSFSGSAILTLTLALLLGSTSTSADHHGKASAKAVPTGCDLLAAHPSDPDKITEGVKTAVVMEHLDLAIAACRRDAALYPELPRLTYYLGRVLFYSGEAGPGFEKVNAAAEAGHGQAQFVAGLLARGGSATGSPDPCLALEYWEKARAQGHYAATLSVAAHQKMGSFAGCKIPQPDPEAVRASVKALSGHPMAGDYYNQLLVQVLSLAD